MTSPILNNQTLPTHLGTIKDILDRHDRAQLDLAMKVADPVRRVQLSQGLVDELDAKLEQLRQLASETEVQARNGGDRARIHAARQLSVTVARAHARLHLDRLPQARSSMLSGIQRF